MVGLHIRYTDNLRSRGKLKSRQMTHIRQFDDYLRRAVEAESEVRFLLCTDSDFVRERMRTAFPKHIVATRRGKEGSSIQAMAETVLLSQTREIIGTRPSTFSIEAAFMGDVPFTLLDTSAGWVRYLPAEPGSECTVSSSEGPPLDLGTMSSDFAPLTARQRYRLRGREVRDDEGRRVAVLSAEGAVVFSLCDGMRTGWDVIESISHNVCAAKPELREGVQQSIRSIVRELARRGLVEAGTR
jgi:hypothetical protein